MMSPTLTRLLKFVLILAVPYLLVIGAVRLLVTDGYLSYEYARDGFPPDPFGFTAMERQDYADLNFRYVREALPLTALANQRRAEVPLYNERELTHMQDVQAVYQAVWTGWLIILGLALVAAAGLGRNQDSRRQLLSALRAGGLLTAGLVALIGGLAVVAWQTWFVLFHEVFFAAGSWTFAVSDTLIRLFPEKFWFDAAVTIAGLAFLGGAVVSATAWLALAIEPAGAAPHPAPQPMSARPAGWRATPRLRAAGMLALAGWLFWAAFAGSAAGSPSGVVIDFAADMRDPNMPLIRVKAGQSLTLRLAGAQHTLTVTDLGLKLTAPAGRLEAATFTALRPGTYRYVCDLNGTAMSGTLVVEN